VATVLMLGSMALLLMVAGTMEFAGIKAALAASNQALLAKLAMGAFVCGLLIKGGLVPFHGWVLGAYSASPAPTSILLAGIVTKVCGIYAMIRLAASVFPANAAINQVLMLVGAVSIVVGAVLALRQTDMKRLLAYSSISQIGYIVLGLGCGTPLAWAGAIFHLFNHTVFKSLLFVNSAAVERRAGTTDMTRLGQLGSRMPLTNLTSVVGLLSTAGVPPLAGFWSKLLIILALWQAGHYTYAALAVLFSVVTLGYLLSLQRKVFFGKAPENLELPGKPSGWISMPELLLAAVTLGAGLLLLTGSFLVPMGGRF
jgi:formate hydrogenlyase subunit 3/multisubunit Na+/H+ antiporter MnhD subunit